MKKLKVAQIGIGHDHGGLVLNSILKLNDIFELVGFAVPECEKKDRAGYLKPYSHLITHTPEELLNIKDLDAVVIETEEKNLTKYAKMAAERGLAIHMDKPGGFELSDFEELIATVKKNKTVFHTGYMYRYNPAVIELIKSVKEGTLGEIYSVEAHMSCYHTKGKREWIATLPGGMTFFLGCHLIDIIVQIMGMPEEIIPLNTSTGTDRLHSTDYGMVVLKYKNGVSFAKACDVELGGFSRRGIGVFGTKGSMILNPIERFRGNDHDTCLFTDVHKTQSYQWGAVPEHIEFGPFDRYDVMMKGFAEIVRGERENPQSYDYELELYRILQKCIK